MSTDATLGVKALISTTRITLGLIPALGVLVILRLAIHLYRPDIEDAEYRVRDHPFDQLHDCYDFIVIGGGSAGAVVASRLSENPDWKILLLEAGQDENVMSDVPSLFPTLQLSSIDWQFETEPNEGYCLSMINGRCRWPRGKVLGGSSALNAMLYVRGNKRDYDNWERMGNVGWAYKDVFQYFLKSEDMRIPELKENPYHVTGGPLTIEHFNFEQPITRDILKAGEQLGYTIMDVNGETQTGFTRSQATLRDGLRCSSAKAFLRQAAKRPNLHVSVHSFVLKILIDENKRTYGVKFVKHGQQRIIKASKEVILSAGSIQSPQILMLSGIGEAEHLKELGIHPIVNLPGVGSNLQDHIAIGGHSFLFDNPYINGSDYCFNINTAMGLQSFIDFALKRRGILYSMMEAEAMAFVNTIYQDPSEDYPDIQLFIAPTADNMDGGLFGKRANGLTDETYAALYEEILFKPSFSIVPLLLRPKSRGYIKLNDADPFTKPMIVPNYFSDPDDLKVLIEGARIVQALVEQPALKELNTRPNPRRNPGCSEYALMSDEHLECQARHHTLTIYHPVGTCMMGPVDNPDAVVDPRLNVYGVRHLRVIDSSVMPNIVSGNTNAPVIMIAEKASDMIKEDWYDIPEDQATCPDEHHHYTKNSEDNTVQINARPDLFNETLNLFNYYDDKINIPNAEENKLAIDQNHISLLSREKETRSKGVVTSENEVVNYNKVDTNTIQINNGPNVDLLNYPYAEDPTNLQYPIPDNTINLNYPIVSAENFATVNYPQIYPIPPYFSWYPQMSVGQPPEITKQLANYPSNFYGQTYSRYYPNSYDDTFVNTKPPKKYNKHKNNPEKFIPKVKPNEEPLFYQTDEVITPKGQKTCRIWLYYDGVKYEVVM